MKILALDHIQFVVQDLEVSIEFFNKLGLKLDRRTDHYGESAELRMFPGGTVFEIHATEPSENPGHDHFALLVEDLDAAIKELREKGIKISDPRFVRTTGRQLANFRDPSGFRWQLIGL